MNMKLWGRTPSHIPSILSTFQVDTEKRIILREGRPGGRGALQTKESPHDVVPHLVNPQGSIFLPAFGIVLWRVQETNAVCLT